MSSLCDSQFAQFSIPYHVLKAMYVSGRQIKYRNGRITVGTWENGAWNGAFTTTFPDGSHYTGVYMDGEIIGNVIYTDEAGNTSTCDPDSIKK